MASFLGNSLILFHNEINSPLQIHTLNFRIYVLSQFKRVTFGKFAQKFRLISIHRLEFFFLQLCDSPFLVRLEFINQPLVQLQKAH